VISARHFAAVPATPPVASKMTANTVFENDNFIARFLWSARTSDCLQNELTVSIDEAERVSVRAPRQWNNRYRWNFFILR
jgi:hypothetical protein